MILRVSTIVFFIIYLAIVKGDETETCKELCKSCNGFSSFADNRCECNVGDNTSDGTECVIRMRREAEDRGLNLSSCDLSNDQRTTRCTLGLKRKLLGKTKNAIDQVVNYFMNGGPITGSVFQAPPYARLASGDAQPCLGSQIIVQPSTQTIPSSAMSYMGLQPQQFVSSPGSDCSTGAQQQIPNPKHHLLSGPLQQLLTNPQHQLKVSPLHRLVGTQYQVQPSSPAQQYVSPQLPQVQSNQEPQQYISSPNGDCVGASQIITQPTETLPEQEPKETIPQLDGKLQKSSSIPSGPKIGAGSPLKVLKLSDLDPNLVQILSHHLSQPMLGIPQAIQTVSKTPGISDLVAAPGYLLHTLMGRLQNLGSNLRSKSTSHNSPDTQSRMGDSTSAPTENQEENPSVGDINPYLSIPATSCPDSSVSSPFTITLMNPMIGNPMSANPMMSNPMMGNPMMGNPMMGNPMMGNPMMSNPMMGNPMVGNPMMGNPTMDNSRMGNPMMGAPVHISYIHSIPPYPIIHSPMMGRFVSHVPTYIVGSPFGMPYLSNYNPDPSSGFTYNMNGNSDTSPTSPDSTLGDINTYQINKIAETPVLKPKKVCKKSSKEEPSQKVSRDIKATMESISEQVDQKEQTEMNMEAEKQKEYSTTEIPKIERTTTHQPIIEKQTDKKVETENQATEKVKFVKKTQNVGKMKITKEIIKKSKGEKTFE